MHIGASPARGAGIEKGGAEGESSCHAVRTPDASEFTLAVIICSSMLVNRSRMRSGMQPKQVYVRPKHDEACMSNPLFLT
jgi:hypothetical protein